MAQQIQENNDRRGDQPNHGPSAKPRVRSFATRSHSANGFYQRLAAIDRIRDRALETGNVRLLDQADALETAAREQFAQFQYDRKPVTSKNQIRPVAWNSPENTPATAPTTNSNGGK